MFSDIWHTQSMRRLWILLAVPIFAVGCGMGHSSGHTSAWNKGSSYASAHYTDYSMSGQSATMWCQSLAMQFDGTNGAWGSQWENGCTSWLTAQ